MSRRRNFRDQRWLVDFAYRKSESRKGRHPVTHPKFRQVQWGKRVYLIPDGEFLSFCNAVNLGLKPRNDEIGPFYVRMTKADNGRNGEEERRLERAEGTPALPAQWRPFLLKRSLQGQIIDILENHKATIDLGMEDGLKEGMELIVEDKTQGNKPISSRPMGLVKIVGVKARQCIVEPKRPNFFREFKIGQSVSSKIPKKFIDEFGINFFR